ncbi:MAG: hypothetical protein KUG81_10035 [Gammaproteobacteria bacterium]|nr:hypothetical protein [Gammaproteobacteria bacterium]
MNINRKDLPEDYAEMMQTEQHHAHEIVVINDVIRWKENEGVRELVDICNLNHMIADMHAKGVGKNDEPYRRLYRNMGYSLSGYWEVFYWGMNNDDAGEYRPPAKAT